MNTSHVDDAFHSSLLGLMFALVALAAIDPPNIGAFAAAAASLGAARIEKARRGAPRWKNRPLFDRELAAALAQREAIGAECRKPKRLGEKKRI